MSPTHPQLRNEVLNKRLEKSRQKLIAKKLDAIIISSQPNRYYLTGWSGDMESGYLLITKKRAFIITDSRYTEEAVKKVPHFELLEIDLYQTFWSKFFQKLNLKKVGFESLNLSVYQLSKFRSEVKKIKFVPTENLIEEMRTFKDENEINLIKKAAAIADQAFLFILKTIKPGLTEMEVALKLEHFMKEVGAEKNSWENFIVATGVNSSMIHYSAGKRKINKGELLLLDWGCVYQGYHCDISRTVFLGEPNKKQAEVYNLVLAAQKKGIEKVTAGIGTSEIDSVSRNFLKEKTPYYFRHAVGHGVGLEVHELPRINEKSKEKIALGQVFTIEPGIYQPGWGGVRIEDMVLVKEKGIEVLTKAPKEIKDIIVK